MTPKPDCTFDAEKHEYRIDGRPVPHVTGVLRDLIPGWSASDWYLQRGRAVHACAAMEVRGEEFTNDPRIDGQVAAVRKFIREVKPRIIAVELPVYSVRYRYAGTLDLAFSVHKDIPVIGDFKASKSAADPFQCAAYALAYAEQTGEKMPELGVTIELLETGNYRMSESYHLEKYTREFLAMLATHNVRRRLGFTTTEGAENGE